ADPMWLLALTACTAPAPVDSAPPAVDKVVVLVLDGARVEDTFGEGTALDGSPTESILPGVREALLPKAARVVPAVTTGATSTAPGHCDLLAGRVVPHGHFTIRDDEGVGDYLPEWPTFLQAFLDADPDRRALVTGDTPHTEALVATHWPGADGVAEWENTAEGGLAEEDDAAVIARLIERLHGEDPPDFVLANLHAIDTHGHKEDEAAYLDGLRAADAWILRVWKALGQDPDYADRTLLVVTSDHGRHSVGDAIWSDHGDACTGCRQVPIVLFGPGVAEGANVATPWALVDLAPTLAHLLGVPLPFAEGLVMEDLLADPGAPRDRTGLVEPDGGAAVELLPDPATRSRVLVDGVGVSSTDALEARGPAHAGRLTCWREIAGSGDPYWPWEARCVEQIDGALVPVAFAADGVDPWFRPALAEVGDTIWAAWGDNPSGGVAKDDGPPDPVRLARRVGDAWEPAGSTVTGFFPMTPALAATGTSSAIVAFAASDTPARGRYTRRIRLYRVEWADTGVTWSAETSWDLRDAGWGRQERPAVRASGESAAVAFLGYGGRDTAVLLSESADGGVTWSTPVTVPTEGRVLPTVAPVWDGLGRLWWTALSDTDEALACVYTAGATTCSSLGSPRVAGLGAAGDGVHVSIDTGVGAWEIVALP
ncbi:MAG: alkaline phosphatase family protein, partial [Myxococcota bacterium]